MLSKLRTAFLLLSFLFNGAQAFVVGSDRQQRKLETRLFLETNRVESSSVISTATDDAVSNNNESQYLLFPGGG